MLQLHDWMLLFSSTVRNIDTGGFIQSITRPLKMLVPVENLVIMMFRENAPPTVLHDALHEREHEMFYRQYMKGGYLFSPYYHAWRHDAGSGLYRMLEIMPEDFADTDAYRNYYLQNGLMDDMGYLIDLEEDAAILIGFGIYSREYTADELTSLREIEPMITACGYRHWHRMGKLMPDSSNLERQIHQKLEGAIDNFGDSILSNREAEIAQLLLRGHTTKSAAGKLNIAPGTVKNHRNNIYFKLDINSQSELFSLFIQSVIHTQPGQAGDPLTGFFDRPAH